MSAYLCPDDMPRFQEDGIAWNPLRPDAELLLQRGKCIDLQPIYYGSNHCFLASIDSGEEGRSLAVYKPARGEYPLYDFASGTLFRREVGSWLVNKLLGWSLIPPTVEMNGRYGAGSLQLFIEARDSGEVEVDELKRLALLDFLLNNADRKADHLLVGDEGKLWGIDHGLTFHVQPKLRTVLWHFAGAPIPPEWTRDLRTLRKRLHDRANADAERLRGLLSAGEWRALVERLNRLIESEAFPNPRQKSVPYRW
jgi:hypothetical protein